MLLYKKNSFHFINFLRVYVYSPLNEDLNQSSPQFSSGSYKSNNKSGSENSDEDKFPFGADIFAEETNDIESDDFYGRTREIIIFAEKGNKTFQTI